MTKKEKVLAFVDEIRDWLVEPDSDKKKSSIEHWLKSIEKEYEVKK